MKCVKESDVQRQLRQGRFLWNLRNRLECDQHVVRKSMHMVKRLAFFFGLTFVGKFICVSVLSAASPVPKDKANRM